MQSSTGLLELHGVCMSRIFTVHSIIKAQCDLPFGNTRHESANFLRHITGLECPCIEGELCQLQPAPVMPAHGLG
jgi:hypothetical protein